MHSTIDGAFGNNVSTSPVKIPPSAGRPIRMPSKVPISPPGVKIPITTSSKTMGKNVAFSMVPEVIQNGKIRQPQVGYPPQHVKIPSKPPSVDIESINIGYKSPASVPQHTFSDQPTQTSLQSHDCVIHVGHKSLLPNGPVHGRTAQYSNSRRQHVSSGHFNTFGEWIDTTSPESIAHAGPYRPSGRTHEWTDSGRLNDLSPTSKGNPKWCERERELYERLEDVCREVEFSK